MKNVRWLFAFLWVGLPALALGSSSGDVGNCLPTQPSTGVDSSLSTFEQIKRKLESSGDCSAQFGSESQAMLKRLDEEYALFRARKKSVEELDRVALSVADRLSGGDPAKQSASQAWVTKHLYDRVTQDQAQGADFYQASQRAPSEEARLAQSLKTLKEAGLKLTADRKRFDLSRFDFSQVRALKEIRESLRALVGDASTDAIVKAYDPQERMPKAVRIGDRVIVPNRRTGGGGFYPPGGPMVVSADEYEKQVNSTLDIYRSSAADYLQESERMGSGQETLEKLIQGFRSQYVVGADAPPSATQTSGEHGLETADRTMASALMRMKYKLGVD